MAGETISTVATIETGPARAGAQQFNQALSSMRDGAARTSQALDAVSSATSALRSAFGLVAGAFAVKSIVDAADEYTRLKVRLESLTGSAEAGAEVLSKIKAAAREARMPSSELADAFGKMAGQLKDVNLSQDQAIDALGLLSKAIQLGGGTADDAKRSFELLSNSFVHGRVEMRQFFGLMQDAPLLMQKFQEQTGMSAEQLRKMAQYGKISGELLTSVLLKSADDINAKFQEMPRTIGGAFSVLSSRISTALGEALQKSGITKDWVKAIDDMKDGVRQFADVLAWAAGKLLEFQNVLKQFATEQASKSRQLAQDWNNIPWDKPLVEAYPAMLKFFIGWDVGATEAADKTSTLTERTKLLGAAMRNLAPGNRVGGDWTAAVTPAKAAPDRDFKLSDMEKQAKIAIDMERIQGDLARARALDQKDLASDIQTELDIRQKVTKELREANPLLAKQYEAQIRVTNAGRRQAELLAENVQLSRSFGQTMQDDLINGIKAGDGFSKILRKMIADMIELIAKATILGPLLKSMGQQGGSLLSGLGFNPENGLLGMFGLGGSTEAASAANGGFSTTVTPSFLGFADGGTFNVGGSGGTDSQLVQFKASPDENVTITKPGQRSSSGDGGQIVVHFAPIIQGDATDSTIAKMRMMAEQVFAQRSPKLVRSAVSAVADEHRRDRGYLGR